MVQILTKTQIIVNHNSLQKYCAVQTDSR